VRDNLAAFVAGLDGCGAGAVSFAGGEVRTPKSVRSFDEVVKAWRTPTASSCGAMVSTARPRSTTTRPPSPAGRFTTSAYGAACTEVAIDTLTGESRVLKVDILHDVGTSINPAIDIGQIEGGFVQGMGWLTTEQLVWNDKGHLATHAPSTYKIPATGDIPRTSRWTCGPSPTAKTTCLAARPWASRHSCWPSACGRRCAMPWRRRAATTSRW
jgi:xanthine dehydrogenase large subunit